MNIIGWTASAREKRKEDDQYTLGGVVEDNSFGTHEYFELCRQLGCSAYVNGNLGSGTVREMSEWVEYITFKGLSPMAQLREANGSEEAWDVKFWGVGNENWGCGGNMNPEYYANEYRRYQTYIRDYRNDGGIKKNLLRSKCRRLYMDQNGSGHLFPQLCAGTSRVYGWFIASLLYRSRGWEGKGEVLSFSMKRTGTEH